MNRFIVIVLDGFGIGALEDTYETRPTDVNANTLKHSRSLSRFEVTNTRKVWFNECSWI
jgi:phosphopentomutase